ncbi:hypothetical protein BCR36DRAFT_580046 [Piromyces finnis]|uniref:Uncharacterized protein n=1 Tax=Piromyces finnis TaxID=1754191 RepID=A0A1Y1VKY9_9FUNG|nr:hypothetical protein BCR36DRAFT_580046 [Piromyces finnis]|eukprot:ORX58428.1 hypothetical protein BCR36DRAFT_580046 [Piromyces finnis]
MKFSKVLLTLATIATLSFAEEVESEKKAPTEETTEEKIMKEFPKPKFNTVRTKEQCEQGFELLKSVYADIEKDPKCTFNEKYAEEHNYNHDYTMDISNRDYFCNQCLTKYLKLGNPMAAACGENSPREMIFDLYFLSSVNAIVCAKDKLHDRYCEVVMDELFEKEKDKSVLNWSEDSLCGECPYYYHDIFKERPDFYKSVSKDSTEDSFIGRILPLRDINIDCYKEFDEKKAEALKEAKKNKKAKNVKNVKVSEELEENNDKKEDDSKDPEEKSKKPSEAGEL